MNCVTLITAVITSEKRPTRLASDSNIRQDTSYNRQSFRISAWISTLCLADSAPFDASFVGGFAVAAFAGAFAVCAFDAAFLLLFLLLRNCFCNCFSLSPIATSFSDYLAYISASLAASFCWGFLMLALFIRRSYLTYLMECFPRFVGRNEGLHVT